MYRVGKFEKVSKQQFIKDFKATFEELSVEEIEDIYENIKLPTRATKGSAGYDFYAPVSFS
ncbi:MAG: deoxyuridine 5'-triphosphate nucleotidohydrolase, partial [Erysipelotrichaceae bacterium]|nr:deoxyuridine 5'-triphosphate nucleotidohydrolase [Erysipelotrichaceae bacterium]